jgi:hypothetical protein
LHAGNVAVAAAWGKGKARSAVLGQALTSLKSGRGWVQMLVGKQ